MACLRSAVTAAGGASRTRLASPLAGAGSVLRPALTASSAACAAAGSSRSLSDFAYVRPGFVQIARHKVRWRDGERYEAWKTDTIPYVQGPVPRRLAAAGLTAGDWYKFGHSEAEGTLGEAYSKGGKSLFLVNALKAVLEARGAGDVIPAAKWAELTAPPTEAEIARIATADGRRAEAAALAEDVKVLGEALDGHIAEAMDSGAADMGVPLDPRTREALQTSRAAPLLAAIAPVVRRMSLLGEAADAAMHPAERERMAKALPILHDDAFYDPLLGQGSGHAEVYPHESLGVAAGGGAAVHGASTSTVGGDAAQDADRTESYAEYKRSTLLMRDRLESVPRRKLPPGLHVGAPSVELENVARLLEDNGSMSAADKAWIMEHYADALAGSEAPFTDEAAQRAAIVDAQPRWRAYDPAFAARVDDIMDAGRGAGAYSWEKGFVAGEKATPPSSIGERDGDPSRSASMGAAEEVAAAMAQYDAAEAEARGGRRAALRNALALRLGLTNPDAFIEGVDAAKSGKAAAGAGAGGKAAAGGKEGKGKAGAAPGAAAGASAGLPAGVTAPAWLPEGAAAEVVSTFFSKYMAGARSPLPTPPVSDPRKSEEATALRNAPKAAGGPAAAAPAKGKGKGKK